MKDAYHDLRGNLNAESTDQLSATCSSLVIYATHNGKLMAENTNWILQDCIELALKNRTLTLQLAYDESKIKKLEADAELREQKQIMDHWMALPKADQISLSVSSTNSSRSACAL